MEPLVKENGICEVVGPGKEAQMKRTRGRATPELGSRKMRFLSKGNFFLNTTLQNGVTDHFSINIRKGFMWQQLLSHSWNHIFQKHSALGCCIAP